MKKKIVSMGMILCMFCLVVLPTLAQGVKATTDLASNELLKIQGETITKTTTIAQVNRMFGEPKIETECAFGGKAYSYFDDAYSYYLYLETDATGSIKAYGAIGGNFKAKRYAQGDKHDGYYWHLSGEIIENYRENTVMGIMEYNCNSADVNAYWNLYEKNASDYLYGLQQHCIAASKVVGTQYDRSFVQTYADEDVFYRNEQLKYNGSDIYEYANNTGKTESIEFCRRYTSQTFYESLPNPIGFGRSTLYYEHTANYAYTLYDINMVDYATRKYNETVLFIDPSCLEERKSVELTQEEKNKLAAAQEQYDLYTTHAEQIGSGLYEREPQYTELPLDAGKYKTIALQAVTDFLNVARAGLGIGTLRLNEEIADCAQHKATLVYYMNQNGMGAGHFPIQPEGVSDAFYGKAQSYMNENLFTGTIQTSICYALNDGYGESVACGHRYNLLGPSYTEWGVGAVGSGISFGWQGAHKFSGNANFENELVAWPSNGIMPIDLVGVGIGNWTAKFYKGYKVTSDSEVTVKCLNTDAVYEITKANRNESGKELSVTGTSLITFRDDAITYEDGDVFEITIHKVSFPDGTIGDYTYRSVFHNFYQENAVETTGIHLNTNTVTLTVGQKERVLALAEPENASNKMMQFTSSNEAVAKVRQDGMITALGEGTTTITVECGGNKETITVVVNKALKGDVNKDGYVRLYDAFKILEQAILGGKLTKEELYIMDYNEDGKVNLFDAFRFLEQAILS